MGKTAEEFDPCREGISVISSIRHSAGVKDMLNTDVHPRSHLCPQVSHVTGRSVSQDMIPLDHAKQFNFEISVTHHHRPGLITHDCFGGHQHCSTRPIGGFVEHCLSGAYHRRSAEREITSYLILIQQDGERAVVHPALLIDTNQREVQLATDIVDSVGLVDLRRFLVARPQGHRPGSTTTHPSFPVALFAGRGVRVAK